MRTPNITSRFPAVLCALVLASAAPAAELTPTFVPTRLNDPYADEGGFVWTNAFSADGSRLFYFQADASGSSFSLFSSELDGAIPPVTMRGPGGQRYDPNILLASPDGSHAIARSEGVFYRAPADGGEPVAFVHPGRILQSQLTFSQDGALFAVVGRPEDFNGASSVSVFPAAGGEPALVGGAVNVGNWFRFTPDGSELVFRGTTSPNNQNLFKAPADGSSPPVVLSDPAGQVYSQEMTSDGSQLLFVGTSPEVAAQTLRKIDVETGASTILITAEPNESLYFVIGEDGSTVLVFSNRPRVRAVDIATGTTILTKEDPRGFAPIKTRLSPDSSHIAHVAGGQIIGIPLDGTPEKVLSDTAVADIEAFSIIGISGDSSRVVFFASVDGRNPQLFSNTFADDDLRRLNQRLLQDQAIEGDMRMSADGAHVLYRADTVTEGDDYLFRVPIAGGPPLQLHASGVEAGDVDSFFENPNGTGVGFAADLLTNSVDEVFYRRYGVPGAMVLSARRPGSGGLRGFEISADSNRVVYSAEQRRSGAVELFSVESEGGRPLQISPPGGPSGDIEYEGFKLSSDGQHAVFLADLDINTVHELYTTRIDAGGSLRKKLHPDLSDNRDVWAFEISPDGQWVAVLGDIDVDRRGELYLSPIDGSSSIKISPEQFGNSDVDLNFEFSPDSQHIAFSVRGTLYIYHLATGLCDVCPNASTNNSAGSLTFTPDSSGLLYDAGVRYLQPVGGGSRVRLGTDSGNTAHDAFTLDGRYIWAAGNALLIADLETAEVSAPLGTERLVGSNQYPFAFAPNTEWLIAAHGSPGMPVEVTAINTGSGENHSLYIADGPQQMTKIETDAAGRIAYFHIGVELHRADLDSAEPSVRINPGLEIQTNNNPAFSSASVFETFVVTPGGEVVYFLARPEGSGSTPGLFRYDHAAPDGENLTAVVQPGSGVQGVKTPIKLTPDARQAVFMSDHLIPGVLDLFSTMPGFSIANLRPTGSDQDAIEATALPALTDVSATEALLDKHHWTGLRFESLSLPDELQMHSARLVFTASADTSSDTRELLIRAQAGPDVPAFQSGAFNINNRPPIAAAPQVWPLSAWAAGQRYPSPDLSGLLRGVIAQPTWVNGDPVVLTMFGRSGPDGEPHRAWLYDGDPAFAPSLEIDFVTIFQGRTNFGDWARSRGVDVEDEMSDPDGDGLANIVEYALAGNPKVPDPTPAPVLRFEPTDSGELGLALVFERVTSAVSAIVTLEASNDLETWTPIASSTAGASVIALDPGAAIAGEAEIFDETGVPLGITAATITLDGALTAAEHFRYRVSRR